MREIFRLVLRREADPGLFDLVHFFVRKAAHVFEYAVLSVLFFRAARADQDGWLAKWSVIAATLATLVAIADESLQALTSTRTGTPKDVALDVAAVVLAQAVIRRRMAR